MTEQLKQAAQAALNACERIVDQEDSPVQFGIDFRALGSSLRRALTQRPAAQTERIALKLMMIKQIGEGSTTANSLPHVARIADEALECIRQHPAAQTERWLVAAVDAAMVEMKNISPPLRRSECERLIRAAAGCMPAPPAGHAGMELHPNSPGR